MKRAILCLFGLSILVFGTGASQNPGPEVTFAGKASPVPAPLAYWPMCGDTNCNPSSNTAIPDLSGNGYAATWSGTPAGTNGYYSASSGAPKPYGAYTDGSTDTAITSALVSNAAINWTMTMWVNFRTLPQSAVLFYNGTNGGSGGYGFIVGNGNCGSGNGVQGIFGGKSCSAGGSITLSAGTWYFFALVNTGSTTYFYENCSQTGSFATAPNPPAGATNLIASPSFAGQIQSLRFYNSALTATQECYLYTNKL